MLTIRYIMLVVSRYAHPQEPADEQHAAEIDSRHRGKETDVVESHMTRDKIDVEVRYFYLLLGRC